MDTVGLFRELMQNTHWFLETTVAGVTDEQAHWTPPGTATPLGASYAHVVISEDMLVNMLFKQSAPLCVSSWAGRNGVSEPMPMPGPEWENYGDWSRRVRVDLPALQEYAQAVYAQTDETLAGLTESDLSDTMDLSMLGFGVVSKGWVIGRLLIGHVDNITGEISCLKGLQGLKGYPA